MFSNLIIKLIQWIYFETFLKEFSFEELCKYGSLILNIRSIDPENKTTIKHQIVRMLNIFLFKIYIYIKFCYIYCHFNSSFICFLKKHSNNVYWFIQKGRFFSNAILIECMKRIGIKAIFNCYSVFSCFYFVSFIGHVVWKERREQKERETQHKEKHQKWNTNDNISLLFDQKTELFCRPK